MFFWSEKRIVYDFLKSKTGLKSYLKNQKRERGPQGVTPSGTRLPEGHVDANVSKVLG